MTTPPLPLDWRVEDQGEDVLVWLYDLDETKETYAFGMTFQPQEMKAWMATYPAVGNARGEVEALLARTHRPAYISHIEVSPLARGRGVGGELLKRMEAELALRGVDLIVLWAVAQPLNRQADLQRWYRTHGYEMLAPHPVFFKWLTTPTVAGRQFRRPRIF